MQKLKKDLIKWILFDFGGCLDCDGTHSRELFFNCFKQSGGLKDIPWKTFQEAYSYSDKLVINKGIIKLSPLAEMNQLMSEYICEHLSLSEKLATNAADLITKIQSFHLKRNSLLLKQLSQDFNLGIISNFSGNLDVILKEFSIYQYFNFTIDSFHIGHTKPAPEIFELALKKSAVKPNNILYIGDNPLRDIAPAKKMGMTTGLIKNKDNKYIDSKDSQGADIILYSLLELPKIIHNE